jgi:pilus assembly protein CpaD
MMLASKTSHQPSIRVRGFLKVIPLAFAALALAGCEHDGNGSQVAGWTLIEPTQRHPIMVSQQPASMNVNVARGSQGLTPSQRADVVDFTSRYKAGDAGNSRLVISAPSASPNEVAAMRAVDDIRTLLLDGGFSDASIVVEAYNDERSTEPPIRISYMRYVAEGPECGHDWSENLANTRKNMIAANQGCATQHNLAAMIANPADLLGPRNSGSRYSERRDDVFKKYTQGKSTGAEKNDDERIRVSN